MSSFFAVHIPYTIQQMLFQQNSEYFFLSEFRVVETGQFYAPGDGGVLSPEHLDVEFGIAGKGIFQTVAGHTEPELDVADLIVFSGEGELVFQTVSHSFFQHVHIVGAGVEGTQVFAEVAFPLGAEGVRIDAGTQVVQLHLGTIANVDAGDVDGSIKQQKGNQHHGAYDKKAGVDGDVPPLVLQKSCHPVAITPTIMPIKYHWFGSFVSADKWFLHGRLTSSNAR